MSVLLLDVNVVLAAHRDDHPDFAISSAWLNELIESERQFGVPWPVWWAFLRLATNRRIFPVPTPLSHALDFVRAIQEQPGYLQVDAGPRHLAVLARICADADVSADQLTDAVIAAIAVEHGGAVVSFDRDFARFGGLAWQRPQ